MPAILLLLLALFLFAVASPSRKRDDEAKPSPGTGEHASPLPISTQEETTMSELPCLFHLTPGHETFSPEELPEGQLFTIALEGTYTYKGIFWLSLPRHADACYDAGLSENYTARYQGLHLDMKRVHALPLQEDRGHHRYSFRYRGTSRKLAILVELPIPWTSRVSGSLRVTIEPLSLPEQDTLEAEERAQRQAQEQRTREIAEQRQARLREIIHHAETFPHYQDPAFVEDYAKKYRDALLQDRGKILEECVEFYRDQPFVTLLQEQRPELIAHVIWRARALAIAERLDLEIPPPPPPSPPRKKLTAEEVRAYKVRHEQVQADDKIALKKAKIDAILKARAFLNEYDLNEDERQMLEQELIEDILSEETDHGHGKTL